MSKILVIGAASIALLAAPAIAMTSDANAIHTKTQTATNSATSVRKAVHRHHHDRLSMNASTRGDKEVRALNTLEAAGYRQFGTLHAHGSEFVTTATKAGHSYNVTVMPSGKIQANNA